MRAGIEPPVSRQASRKERITDMKAPARPTTSQRSGAMLPNGANSVVNITVSGFHDGPSVVTRSKWMISRPQTIQAHGS